MASGTADADEAHAVQAPAVCFQTRMFDEQNGVERAKLCINVDRGSISHSNQCSCDILFTVLVSISRGSTIYISRLAQYVDACSCLSCARRGKREGSPDMAARTNGVTLAK